MKIGVVGFSSHNIDESLASRCLRTSFIELIKVNAHNGKPGEAATIEIVSGLTNIGVPKLAYQIADAENYFKVGISAQQAHEVDCGCYPVDKEIIVGRIFGDESETFIEYIDYLVRVGGGQQSHRETELFRQKCTKNHWALDQRLIEKDLQY
ncbi:MAG: hypothetical protein ACI9FB_003158 [Candidatus Azotimanducaceae bacterium]|jgi:hypothetical protein